MSVSGRSAFTKAFESLLFEVIHLPLPTPGNEQTCFQCLETQLNTHAPDIAAFIFEPLVLGAGGMLMYEAETLDALMRRCKEHEILCIADEVMTGFGRTGELFACNYLKEEPDIICLSKGITGGTMPLGVTTCKEEIYDAFLSDDKMKTFFMDTPTPLIHWLVRYLTPVWIYCLRRTVSKTFHGSANNTRHLLKN